MTNPEPMKEGLKAMDEKELNLWVDARFCYERGGDAAANLKKLFKGMRLVPAFATQAESGLPSGWAPLTIEHEPGYPEDVAYGPQIMMDRLKKWLDRYYAFVLAERHPSPPAQSFDEEVEKWIASHVSHFAAMPLIHVADLRTFLRSHRPSVDATNISQELWNAGVELASRQRPMSPEIQAVINKNVESFYEESPLAGPTAGAGEVVAWRKNFPQRNQNHWALQPASAFLAEDALSMGWEPLYAAPQAVGAHFTPSEPGIYSWVPTDGAPALVLVNRRPSAHSPGGILSGHCIKPTEFYDGAPVTSWGKDGKWILLRSLIRAANPPQAKTVDAGGEV